MRSVTTIKNFVIEDAIKNKLPKIIMSTLIKIINCFIFSFLNQSLIKKMPNNVPTVETMFKVAIVVP
ncbi:hypothetical protein WR164_02620 [Philodulcilactobacillus myokoensis]|uniref:Uncharacterized protein n=1 Tax=Philodulcilactobacillus myokoensis TaxID=2929573 RepID=A0A9W6ESF7_9LACO|nr:hypothetical protein WR164_02620 [Philodulcilactobacillus myokoensis]